MRSPRVVQAVRRHFNCSSLAGAEVENDGGGGSAGSHWERRVYMDEFMTATSVPLPLTTELSLASETGGVVPW